MPGPLPWHLEDFPDGAETCPTGTSPAPWLTVSLLVVLPALTETVPLLAGPGLAAAYTSSS